MTCITCLEPYHARMKLLFAILVYLIMGVVLGLGILYAVKGSWAFLIAGVLAYLILLTKIGCLPTSEH